MMGFVRPESSAMFPPGFAINKYFARSFQLKVIVCIKDRDIYFAMNIISSCRDANGTVCCEVIA